MKAVARWAFHRPRHKRRGKPEGFSRSSEPPIPERRKIAAWLRRPINGIAQKTVCHIGSAHMMLSAHHPPQPAKVERAMTPPKTFSAEPSIHPEAQIYGSKLGRYTEIGARTHL